MQAIFLSLSSISFLQVRLQSIDKLQLSMSLTQLFQRKLKLQMKLIHVIDKKPKQIIKLDPIDAEDYIVSHEAIRQWSDNNEQLYQAILQNGMAQFICNKEFLYQFYRHLSFNHQNISKIDQSSLSFKNLKSLYLLQNQIKAVQNIPSNCKQLYLDFNLINSIRIKPHNLELLSISNNLIDDQSLSKITQSFPELRCLNVSWNKICNLRQFVTNLASLSKLKILVSYANPISMLTIYYTYITEHIHLGYIDGEKYVKVEEVKKEEPKVQEKKEVKEEKKDNKKDNKKGGKVVQQKPPEEPPKVEPPKQIPKKQLTKQDFQQVKLNIKVGNLQKFSGNTYDTSLFPADTDVSKTQTSYWIKYQLLGQQVEQKAKTLNFDTATVQNDQIRLNFDVSISKKFQVNHENFNRFNQGIKIEVYQSEPKMIKDPQTFQLKPEIKDNVISANVTILGATHIDLRKLHLANKKQEKVKYVLFNAQAVKNPLFYDSYEDQKEMISKRKENFEAKLKKIEEQRLKKIEQEQLLKQQKKGGKDQKKAADKKAPPKKDGKDTVVIEKKKAQKCDFPVEQREYCIIDNDRMFKGKQLLCVLVKIQ